MTEEFNLEKEKILAQQVEPLTNDQKKLETSQKRFKTLITSVFNRLIPEFAPKMNLNEKLIDNETKKDYAMIRYYSELQIFIGVIIFTVGLLGFFVYDAILVIVAILGFVLALTGFDIEEIYVTNIRLLIRRIGLLERIIRIPSDEEHLLRHVVSLNVGRAPTHKILMALAGFGFFIGIASTFTGFIGLLIFISALVLFIFGLRLGKRVVTLNLAGGHFIVLGARKGVPTHLIQSIMTSTFAK